MAHHAILSLPHVEWIRSGISDFLGQNEKVTAQSGDGIGFALPVESTLALLQPRCKLLGHGF
jgi:hypothetical protein